jgi:CheY-like chemotaxis protein
MALVSQKKILIIEDDADIARNLKAVLEGDGFAAETAKDGLVALELLRASQELPSLLLLDLMMPGMDGFQFRELQEQDPRLALIPVVIMTADGHVEAKKQKVGAKAFIRKPVDICTVVETVSKYAL